MKRYEVITTLIFLGILVIFGLISLMKKQTLTDNRIHYVALGDSYTIGEGAKPGESYPAVLTKHLSQSGVAIELSANPSVTGWTTTQVIENELSVYDASHPTFATLLIGVNDWVQGVSKETFRKNLSFIIDHMLSELPNKKNLILITIPDFSVTPAGKEFGNPVDNERGITEFNAIIKDEAKKRRLMVVDIYSLTQHMQDNPDLVAGDGLHPSAKEYALWEEQIYPAALKLLKGK